MSNDDVSHHQEDDIERHPGDPEPSTDSPDDQPDPVREDTDEPGASGPHADRENDPNNSGGDGESTSSSESPTPSDIGSEQRIIDQLRSKIDRNRQKREELQRQLRLKRHRLQKVRSMEDKLEELVGDQEDGEEEEAA
jgi:hypothetical protein